MIGTSVYNYLLSKPDISGFCGNRIYPLTIPPSSTYPAIAYQRTSVQHGRTQDGSDGTARTRLMIRCWAKTYIEATQAAEYVRLAMDTYTGAMDGHTVMFAFLAGEIDEVVTEPESSEPLFFGVRQDWDILHTEAVPTL